ncbi:carbohydrate kinase [Flavobacteriaceae bacterium TP-CH-4]|uniref:Carbohydrate kinase n=1 Tax=Pelagihabitans pacificus TaxID=2696054 RepID=A0A967B1V4_9FLAO|nr:FGGY family carbohydrate kinase [Pelagihabitans pacificus]NHF61572.1 carbohydrate kinase [Pelagihabitans pacificus]
MKKVTAVFDIGKTNKKFFLFDDTFQEVYREYASFEPIEDEDGFITEDLKAVQRWLRSVINRVLQERTYDVRAVNFSTYGASLVHLDGKGEVLTPLYNYTKPLEEGIKQSFFGQYGPEETFTQNTGAPYLGMLNSGMQLYWLKQNRPAIFKKIRYSLHLPQYISYLFTGIPLSEYTSIGCHTALWDFGKQDYHEWIYKEGLHSLFPPIVSARTSIHKVYKGKRIRFGTGIHDSSAALLPYIRSIKKKFLLVSTGTWSITMNPFSQESLQQTSIKDDCIDFLGVDGKPVRATRLFLGNEYTIQVAKLSEHFHLSKDYHKKVRFDEAIYANIAKGLQPSFKWEVLATDTMPVATDIRYDSFEEAYHHLMVKLVQLQVKSIKMAQGHTKIKRLYVDGGFSNNDCFIKLLSRYLGDMKVQTTDASLGSALGAAMVISDKRLDRKFLKKHYSLKKHLPFITK